MTDQDKEDIIYKLKDTPELLDLMLKIQPDIMRPPTEEERREIYEIAIGLTSIVAKKYKQEITARLDETLCGSGEPPQFTKEANTVWEIILAALLLNPPQDIILTIADRLGYSAEKLEQIKGIAQGKQDIDNNDFSSLPLFAPPPDGEEKNKEIPAQADIDFKKGLLKATSSLSRKIGFVLAAQNMDIALDIPRHVDIDKSKRRITFDLAPFTAADGTPQTITPYDQEVENTLSNLFEEGNREVTSQQIFCKMNGITSKGKRITRAAIAEIETSIRKLNRTFADFRIKETINGEERERRIMDGHILDTFYVEDCFISSGKVKAGWRSTRPGILYLAEKAQNNRLVTIKPEQLNLLDSGISLTPLSIAIRRFCLDEIFRIAATGSYKTTSNKFLLERFYTYDRDPALTEIIPPQDNTGEIIVKLKTGADAAEQSKIRMAKKHRRDLLQDILEHLKATGALNNWDFVTKDQVIPYRLVTDTRNPKQKKRQYNPRDISLADGVLLDVPKTTGASKLISAAERKKQDNEKASRRAKR